MAEPKRHVSSGLRLRKRPVGAKLGPAKGKMGVKKSGPLMGKMDHKTTEVNYRNDRRKAVNPRGPRKV